MNAQQLIRDLSVYGLCPWDWIVIPQNSNELLVQSIDDPDLCLRGFWNGNSASPQWQSLEWMID